MVTVRHFFCFLGRERRVLAPVQLLGRNTFVHDAFLIFSKAAVNSTPWNISRVILAPDFRRKKATPGRSMGAIFARTALNEMVRAHDAYHRATLARQTRCALPAQLLALR